MARNILPAKHFPEVAALDFDPTAWSPEAE